MHLLTNLSMETEISRLSFILLKINKYLRLYFTVLEEFKNFSRISYTVAIFKLVTHLLNQCCNILLSECLWSYFKFRIVCNSMINPKQSRRCVVTN